MLLTRLVLGNYRCFPARQELELSPITVVLGKNNSGKSALVRAPLVLSTGIGQDSPVPLELGALGDEAPEFTDLVHRRLEHGSITLGFSFHDEQIGPLDFEVTVQNIDEWGTQVVSRWTFRSADDSFALEWQVSDSSQDPSERMYRISGGSLPDRIMHVPFDGLLPVSGDDQAADESDDRLTRFNSLRRRVVSQSEQIRHLGPFRGRPARADPLMKAQPVSIGRADAADLGRALVSDHVRGGARVITAVNRLLVEHFPNWELEVRPSLDAYSVGLRSRVDRDLWVALTDSGSGIAQVLPILVHRAQDELQPPRGGVLEIHEEPELHLHPSAQAEIADIYVEAAKSGNVRFLIETHSETFLLRLRRRIAEHRIDPEALRLYFVENSGTQATARRISVDPVGNVDYWPPGIFSENFEETKALAVAQLDREDDDAR